MPAVSQTVGIIKVYPEFLAWGEGLDNKFVKKDTAVISRVEGTFYGEWTRFSAVKMIPNGRGVFIHQQKVHLGYVTFGNWAANSS